MYHKIEQFKGEERPFICTVCSMSWVRNPGRRSGLCPGVRYYGWQTAPEYLKTYTQLRAAHLKPRDRRKPDGSIIVHGEWCWLYDEREALPRRRCSDLQVQALRNAWKKAQEKYTCQRCGAVPSSLSDLCHNFGKSGYCDDCMELAKWEFEQWQEEQMIREDRNQSIIWARNLLERNDWAIIDTETTSLDGVAIEICAIAPDGSLLFHSLIKPDMAVTPEARAVHGIGDEELATAPELAEVWPDLQKSLEGRTLLLAYNEDFDSTILSRGARRAKLSALPQKWECIMEAYAAYCGAWSDYWHSYTWQPLPGAGHRAKGDALAALDLLKHMAAATIDESDDTEDYSDEHPQASI